jgi:hypothetical protein
MLHALGPPRLSTHVGHELQMSTNSKALRTRLFLSSVCCLVLASLYVRALSGGSVFGAYSSFAHPWRDIPSDLLIFALCAAILVILSPFLRLGSRWQRVCACVAAAPPLWVLGNFVLWWIFK